MTTPAATVDATTAGDAWRRGGRLLHALRLAGPPAVVFVLAIGAWYAASYLLLEPRRRWLLPPPDQVIRIGFGDPASRAELLSGLALSAQVALIGLAIATIWGIGAGVLMSQARWLERSLYPYAVGLQSVPILAMVPLLGFWFGYGTHSRVLVCVLISVFPIVGTTLFGVRGAERGHHDLFTLHHAGRWTRLVKLQLPSALPAIFAGLRISAGLSVVGAIVGDFFFRQGTPGLGRLIDTYRSRLQAEEMLAAVLLGSLFGIAVFVLFTVLARTVAAWHQSTHDHGH
jgi:NitT/TauT family transport system permease protein